MPKGELFYLKHQRNEGGNPVEYSLEVQCNHFLLAKHGGLKS